MEAREFKIERKKTIHEKAVEILLNSGVEFERISEFHYRVDRFDFWPATGMFMNRTTKLRGQGILNLLKKLGITVG